MRARIQQLLENRWYGARGAPVLLLPLEMLYCAATSLRHRLYGKGWLAVCRPQVPVLVVGNISVGGTGKTPLVGWLARHLSERGRRPGIVTRGYGGKSHHWPREVNRDSVAAEVGDEAVLLARESGCPVVAGPRRGESVRLLLEAHPCDLVIADDGLQHYALGRDLEICVVDGDRGLGNGRCLPAGPLREPPERLQTVDLLVANGGGWEGAPYRFRVATGEAVNLRDPHLRRPLATFSGEEVDVLAGIGNPERFLDGLRGAGIRPRPHLFPDHYPYREADLAPFTGKTLLMTAKDAVKCEDWAGPDHWLVSTRVEVDPGFVQCLEQRLEGLGDG